MSWTCLREEIWCEFTELQYQQNYKAEWLLYRKALRRLNESLAFMQRYHTDAVFRERHRAREKAWFKRRYSDPIFRAYRLSLCHAYQRTDKYRASNRARSKERYKVLAAYRLSESKDRLESMSVEQRKYWKIGPYGHLRRSDAWYRLSNKKRKEV
jgi:hypothetical protein